MPWRSANIEFNSDGRFQVITTPHWVLHWYNDSGVTNPAALYLQITTSIDGSNLFVLRHPNPQNGKRMGLALKLRFTHGLCRRPATFIHMFCGLLLLRQYYLRMKWAIFFPQIAAT
jgi:hypothetical protein